MKLSRVETIGHCGTDVDYITRDLEIPSSNPGQEQKMKITQRSNPKITTTHPSAPELDS